MAPESCASSGREAEQIAVGRVQVHELKCPSIYLSVDLLASMRNCKILEHRFRALLAQDETRQLELVRA